MVSPAREDAPMIVSDYSKIEEQERIWHRRHAIWRARRAGATFTEIGDSLGISKTRVLQMYRKAAHEVLRDKRSPLASELSHVEMVSQSQLSSGLWHQLLHGRGLREWRAKPPKSALENRDEEIRALKVRNVGLQVRINKLVSEAGASSQRHRARMTELVRGSHASQNKINTLRSQMGELESELRTARDQIRSLRLRVMDEVLECSHSDDSL